MHAGHRIQHGLVHVDVDDLRAVLDLLAGHGQRLVVFLFADQARKHLAARHVGAFADVHVQRVFVDVQRFQARQAGLDRNVGHDARRQHRDLLGDRADVVGRGAAAAAGHVHQPGAGEFLEQRRRVGRRFVKAGFGHGIGQAGVGVHADVGVAELGQLGHVGAHQSGAQRTVQADGHRARMAHRVPEGLDGLARQDPAGRVGDRARDHHRQADAAFLEHFFGGENGRLGVERVENGFDQDDVDAAIQQAVQLLYIGDPQFVEGDVARARVVHVRRDRGGLGLGAQRAGHEARLVGRAVLVTGLARQLGGHQVQFVGQFRQVVVALRDRRGAEGIGFDDVGAGLQVLAVDLRNHVRAHQRQQLVVALQVLAVVGEALAAKIGLAQLVALDHRAHGAIQDQDALAKQAGEIAAAGIAFGRIRQAGIRHVQVRMGLGGGARGCAIVAKKR